MPTDVTEDDRVVALATYAATRSGRIDIWFNNAGFEGRPVALDEVDDALVNEVLAVNVKGTYSGMRHAISYMPGGGVVINNASPAGTKVFSPVGAIYGASKAALDTMSMALARVLAPEIRVIVIAPGMVHTGFVPGRTEEMMAAAAAATPLTRAVEADDVAKAVMACVTHLTHTTGSIVRVDSGSLL